MGDLRQLHDPGRHPADPPSSYRLVLALARPVALGYLSEAEARAILTAHVAAQAPIHPHLNGVCTRLAWRLEDAVAAYERQREHGLDNISRAVWPLCVERRPGREILAAAERVAGPCMAHDDVLTECRSVAERSRGGRRHAR
jgi:hypothetical protein